MTAATDIEVQRAESVIRANFGLPGVVPQVYRLFGDGEPVTLERLG